MAEIQIVNRTRVPSGPVWQRYPVFSNTHTWWMPQHLGLVGLPPLGRQTLESRRLISAKAQSALGSRTVCWFKYVDTVHKVVVLDSSMAHIKGMAKTKHIRLTGILRGALADKALGAIERVELFGPGNLAEKGVKPCWAKFVFRNGISLEAVCL